MKKEKSLDRIQAAEYLGISPYTLRSWASTKPDELPFYKVGRFCQYRKSDLDKYIKSRKVGR